MSFWDILSQDEGEFAKAIIAALSGAAWATPLLADIAASGGLTLANKPKLFELRFGYALQQAGITPAYEIAGEADSTLDFGFTASGRRWRVEMMRLEENAGRTKCNTDRYGRNRYGLEFPSAELERKGQKGIRGRRDTQGRPEDLSEARTKREAA